MAAPRLRCPTADDAPGPSVRDTMREFRQVRTVRGLYGLVRLGCWREAARRVATLCGRGAQAPSPSRNRFMACGLFLRATKMGMRLIRVLLGVCDIGNGHVNRQRCIIQELLSCNVELVLAVTETAAATLHKTFPEIPTIRVSIPWVTCDNDGVDFGDTLRRYRESKNDQFESFLEFAVKARQCFDGNPPDLVMTDYEPNVAQFAYAMDLPLICMEQHSKFLYMDTEEIDGFTVNEGAARLRYFFPRVDHRFISTFSPIDLPQSQDLTVLSPIIRRLEKRDADESKVVVYFSPYGSDRRQFESVLDMLRRRHDHRFHIYTALEFRDYERYPQFTFKAIGDEFVDDICTCGCIITSAGHQLISEAIELSTPLLIYSFSTYDQKYCAKVVEDYGLGQVIRRFDEEEFDAFLGNLQAFSDNMRTFKERYWGTPWNECMLRVLDERFGIRRMASEP